MVDVVSQSKRSEMMSGIKAKDTKPEILVRNALHQRGYRYRLHDKRLPGTPDLVLPKYNAVIFVHGCFWHGHECHLFKWPKTRQEFWHEKITANKARDAKQKDCLFAEGWRVAEIWECSLKGRFCLDFLLVIESIEGWISSEEISLEIRGT